MADHVFLYLIVLLNAVVQLVLIRSLNLPARAKRKYYAVAIAIPVLVMVSMRLLVAAAIIDSRVADQSLIERFVTDVAGILLIAGPWLATVAAIVAKYRHGSVGKPLHHAHRPGKPDRQRGPIGDDHEEHQHGGEPR